MSDAPRHTPELAPLEARRAVERIRSGLFDPRTLPLLTAGVEGLDSALESALAASPAHLCFSGSYGQGKSHALHYTRQRALAQGFAVSFIQLDPRELPFHHHRLVYQAALASLTLPGGATLMERLRAWREESPSEPWPQILPHRWRCILEAACRPTEILDERQRQLKKHRHFAPRAFGQWIRRAMEGYPLSAHKLSHVCRYRGVGGYRGASLSDRDPADYLDATRGLAQLLVEALGCRGWVVLFDEFESITMLRVNSRRRCYEALEQWLQSASSGITPIMAFTPELEHMMRAEGERSPEQLNIHRLGQLTDAHWAMLGDRLSGLHGLAYGWRGDGAELRSVLGRPRASAQDRESRLILKALVEALDLAEQARAPVT